MDSAKELPRVLSLCSGYGGIEEGISRVLGELSVLAHVEIEAFAITNLVNKMETGRLAPVPIWTDLKTLPLEPFRGITDILTGGYPCQPFSAAGKRQGEDDPRHLWPWIRKAIAVIRPEFCFFENVEGHISLGLREVLTDLVGLGYRVENRHKEPTWGIFSAREVGAPHQRKRVFILAHRIGSKWRPQPKITHESDGGNIGREEKASGAGECRQDVAHRVGRGKSQRRGGEQEKRERPLDGGQELADADIRGKQQREYRRMGREWESPSQKWPSRPGEQQYEWEELRVLADAKNTDRGTRKKRQQSSARIGWRRFTDSNRGQVEPELGGAIDGNKDRVDRLRLLGNGVVPAAAEKAFRTLLERMMA